VALNTGFRFLSIGAKLQGIALASLHGGLSTI
jgi:hypothetical protein